MLNMFYQKIIPGPRQRLSDPDLFVNHPLLFTDAFTLQLKATILMSRVAQFNRNVKAHRQSEINNGLLPSDARSRAPLLFCDGYDSFLTNHLPIHAEASFPNDEVSPKKSLYHATSRTSMSVKETSTFKELDRLILAFQLSIPKEYRNPFSSTGRGGFGSDNANTTPDPILYLLYIIPSV
jgi:hypothetical protein